MESVSDFCGPHHPGGDAIGADRYMSRDLLNGPCIDIFA